MGWPVIKTTVCRGKRFVKLGVYNSIVPMIRDWTVDSRFRFPCQWNLDSGLAGIPTFGRIPNSLKWIQNFKAQDFGFHKQTFSDLTPESDNLSFVGIKLHTSNKTSTYKSIRLAIQSKESRKFSFKDKCITRSTNVRGFIQRTRLADTYFTVILVWVENLLEFAVCLTRD